ncbi:hypothetical protein [Streptomyces beigongshangae]|uniref:hypothetical protein n=1 Tax=Streptomyces beigongshangae TaxID=2841597 RepID=UPI0021A8800F|nr:hypothetical protein [Streptomyces sp. REN17]
MLRHSGGRLLDPRKIRPLVLTGTFVLMAALPLAVASAGPVWDEAPAPASAPADARTSVRTDVNTSARTVGSAPGHTYGHTSDGAVRDAGRRASAGGRDSGGRGSEGAPVSGREAGHDDGGEGVPAPAGPAPAGPAPAGPAPAGAGSPPAPGAAPATAARCGPEVTSPVGIEAQTCVLTRGRETWARTYYRNATGGALTSVLTLMAPDGRTVRMHCALGADDEPGACETPRQNTAGKASEHTAVAEFAEGAGKPLLLRSGSNSPSRNGR